MIKVFCNRCETDITKADRYTVQVKHCDVQGAYHYCPKCWKYVKVALEQREVSTVADTQDEHTPEPVKPAYEKPKATLKNKEEQTQPKEEKLGANIRIKSELPKPPTSRTNIDLVHRVLVQYYMKTHMQVILQRNGISYQRVYQVLSRYGSQVIKDKYANLDTKVNDVRVGDVLTLYAAGFAESVIAENELYCSRKTVDDIITEYTGV